MSTTKPRPPATKPRPRRKPAPTEAVTPRGESIRPAAPAPALSKGRNASWLPEGATTHRCAGACGAEKPIKSFPTTANGRRGSECRACRDARRVAAKAKAAS